VVQNKIRDIDFVI